MIITEVAGLFIGNEESCLNFDGPIVHACKHPCYMRVAKIPKVKDDPEYLSIANGRDLFLNMIDPPVPLFQAKTFTTVLDFLDRNTGSLVHCNKGASRSPSIVLLWLARRGYIVAGSYAEARDDFTTMYTAYNPGAGIVTYLSSNWHEFIGY